MRPFLAAFVLVATSISFASADSQLDNVNETLSDAGLKSLSRRTMMLFDPNDKRDECFGVRMRAIGVSDPLGTKSTKDGSLRDAVGPPECVTHVASKQKAGLFYEEKPPAVKTTTTVPKDASLVWKNLAMVDAANAKVQGAYTCDHVLEISMVLDVLRRPGGVCATAQARYDAADENAKKNVKMSLQKKIIGIREIVNNKPNLIFFQGRIEDIKTQNKVNFNRGFEQRAGSNDLDYLAMTDYLLRKTSVDSVAERIDKKILAEFGEDVAKAGSVADYWSRYIEFTRKVAKKVEADVEAEVKKKKEAAAAAAKNKDDCGPGQPKPPGGPWGKPPGGPWGKPPAGGSTKPAARRLTRRDRLDTALRRRAAAVRGASRSGPHAPPAPSCPVPGQTPKTTIPRGKMHTKPAPAKKPRLPVKKPVAKPPPKKKVVPRPVNRPQRQIGKPAPPKQRVTPKKQPKRVPKPPSKPKGKPRPRRRK